MESDFHWQKNQINTEFSVIYITATFSEIQRVIVKMEIFETTREIIRNAFFSSTVKKFQL